MIQPAGSPRRETGKEVVRWNAISHGIRSPAPVVPGLEKPEDWELHLTGTLESLSPKGHLETVLAEKVALLLWRLHRVTRYETESIALFQEKAEDDLARERRLGKHVLGAEHPEDMRDILQAAQAKHLLLKRLPKLEGDERLSVFEVDTVLWAAAEQTAHVIEGQVGPEDMLAEISVPGMPEDIEAWDDHHEWTAGVVRAGVEAVAKATDEDPETLMEAATDAAKRDLVRKEQAAERVMEDLENMSRERLLPDEKILEKVARYEAHLSRLLFKTLHELEALQTRRLGGLAPLARLDVDGLAES